MPSPSRRCARRIASWCSAAELYAATLAGVTYEVAAAERGLYLEVHGFSQTVGRVLSTLCEGVRAVGGEGGSCDEATLSRLVTQVDLKLRTACYAPSSLCMSERLRCLERGRVTAEEKRAALSGVDVESLRKSVAGRLARGVRLLGYVGGNADASEARALLDTALHALGSPPPLVPPPPLTPCVKLPTGPPHVRRLVGRNPSDENCAVDLYWQLGEDTPELAAKLHLLEHLCYEPLFDTLRTKQQLGYTVSCSARHTQGVLGFLLSVVSATHTPDDIEARALTFLRVFVSDHLATMSAAAYEAHVKAAVANRLLDDKTIDDEASRHWAEIDGRSFGFDRA